MKIVIGASGVVALEGDDDFKRLDVEVTVPDLSDAGIARALGPATEVAGDGQFWIDADRVRALSGRGADMAWQRDFTAMLEAVRPYGWSSEDLSRVRVHVARPRP